MTSRNIILSILILFSSSTAFGQDSLLYKFLKRVEDNSLKYPKEKIHLHLDKPYYAVGDDIWFKVYTADPNTKQLSALSGVIYVELINDNNKLLKQLRLPLRSGISWGDFKLADSLTEGNYRIRAYTQWMRNFGNHLYYDKVIKIGNLWSNKVLVSIDTKPQLNNPEKVSVKLTFTNKQNLPYDSSNINYEIISEGKVIEKGKGTTNNKGEVFIATTADPNVDKEKTLITEIILPSKELVRKEIPLRTVVFDIDIQMLPEGGKLVEGLLNKIGVKTINQNGLGESLKGKIIDQDGNELVDLETNKLGMGSFFITPLPNRSYKAKLSLGNGKEKTIDLPQIYKSGTILSVRNTDTANIFVRVYFSSDLLNKEHYNFIAQSNGNIYYSSTLTPTTQILSFSIPKANLPSGILQFSLLSNNFIPLNERIIFINHHRDKIETTVENMAKTYKKRELTELSLHSTVNQKSVQGSFSIAVTNSSIINPDIENESNILSRMLLTSALKGYIENPNYYFLGNETSRLEELDNLLLTQGWSQIDWTLPTPTIIYPLEKKIQISGIATIGEKPIVKGKITLTSFQPEFIILDTLTDANGRFNFNKIEFTDSTKFVLQARTEKGNKNVDLKLDHIPSENITKNPKNGDAELNVNTTIMEYLKHSEQYFDQQIKKGVLSKTISLDEVKIIKSNTPPPSSSSLSWSKRADDVFTQADLKKARSLKDFLNGGLSGVKITDGQAFAFQKAATGGRVINSMEMKPMAVIVNGVDFGIQGFNLENVTVSDIQSVEIFREIPDMAAHRIKEGAGVINLTLKHDANIKSPGIISFEPKGFAVTRTFYSPKYNVKPDENQDLRTTVFWEPNLITDKEGKGKISYFNNDVPGIYRVVIEGMDVDGNLARKVINYEVK